MSLAYSIAAGIGGSIIAALVYDTAKNIVKNKDLQLAIKELVRSTKTPSSKKVITAYLKVTEALLITTLPSNLMHKKLTLYMNASLISSVSVISKKISEYSNERKKSSTIVGMMLSDKIKSSSRIQIILISSLVIHVIVALLSSIDINGFIILIISLALLALHVDHKLIEYRIKKGFYGRNEYEAKEIINYIISHADKNDFNDGNGRKKLIPDPEIDLQENTSKDIKVVIA